MGIIVLLLKHFYNSDFFKKKKILRLINFLEVKIDINNDAIISLKLFFKYYV